MGGALVVSVFCFWGFLKLKNQKKPKTETMGWALVVSVFSFFCFFSFLVSEMIIQTKKWGSTWGDLFNRSFLNYIWDKSYTPQAGEMI